jgi:hypothetical protein
MRAIRDRMLGLAALLPLLALPFASVGLSQFLCRMDGQLRPSCCCPADEIDTDTDTGPALIAATCCQRLEAADNVGTPSELAPVHEAATRALPVTAAYVVLAPPPAMRAPARALDRPPRAGPPLLLQKQSLLI